MSWDRKPTPKFNVDMLLMDPFFVKGLLMIMYNYSNYEGIREDEPELFALLTQVFDEEAVTIEENYVIPNAAFSYVPEVLRETMTKPERLH